MQSHSDPGIFPSATNVLLGICSDSILPETCMHVTNTGGALLHRGVRQRPTLAGQVQGVAEKTGNHPQSSDYLHLVQQYAALSLFVRE